MLPTIPTDFSLRLAAPLPALARLLLPLVASRRTDGAGRGEAALGRGDKRKDAQRGIEIRRSRMDDSSERANPDRAEALSKLEEALRQALTVTTPERVLARVHAVFPALPVEVDTETRFHGKVKKVSVSMPDELTTAVRTRTGPGGFSRYVTEAVEDRLRFDLMDEYANEMDAKNGPVPPELLEEALREWPDYEPE